MDAYARNMTDEQTHQQEQEIDLLLSNLDDEQLQQTPQRLPHHLRGIDGRVVKIWGYLPSGQNGRVQAQFEIDLSDGKGKLGSLRSDQIAGHAGSLALRHFLFGEIVKVGDVWDEGINQATRETEATSVSRGSSFRIAYDMPSGIKQATRFGYRVPGIGGGLYYDPTATDRSYNPNRAS